MKKILFITDSHGNFKNILAMMKKEEPNIVFCGGDYSRDAVELSYVFDDLPFYIVDGNCDMFSRQAKDEEIFKIEDVKILLTHGHLYGVKEEYGALEERAKALNCNLAVFGHTHRTYLKDSETVILYNPGAAKDGYYGIIYIDGKDIQISTKSIN